MTSVSCVACGGLIDPSFERPCDGDGDHTVPRNAKEIYAWDGGNLSVRALLDDAGNVDIILKEKDNGQKITLSPSEWSKAYPQVWEAIRRGRKAR